MKVQELTGAMPGDVQAVRKWGGHVWVGATRLGLFRRKDLTNEWEQFKQTVTAISFDTRGPRLLVGCDDKLAETEDGQKFTGGGLGSIEAMREQFAFGE